MNSHQPALLQKPMRDGADVARCESCSAGAASGGRPLNAPLAPFSEVWHYVKGTDTDNKWLVAGIQQEG